MLNCPVHVRQGQSMAVSNLCGSPRGRNGVFMDGTFQAEYVGTLFPLAASPRGL